MEGYEANTVGQEKKSESNGLGQRKCSDKGKLTFSG